MVGRYAEKKTSRVRARLPVPGESDRLRGQVSALSGTEKRRSVDPVYAVSEMFSQSFDAVGRQLNAVRHEDGDNAAEASGALAAREARLSAETENSLRARHDPEGYDHSRARLAEGDFCDRFSEYAFRRGTLAGAILSGSGKMMLVACFRRAAGNNFPSDGQHEALDSRSSVRRGIGGGASVEFYRDARSAVGLVVDAVRSAARTFDIIRALAEQADSSGNAPKSVLGLRTLRELFPFMRLHEDEALIENYKARLKLLEGDRSERAAAERKMVGAALTKAEGVRNKKLTEQRQFLTKLQEMRSNALEAEKLFGEDGFAETLAASVVEEAAEPPDDEGGAGDNNRRRRLFGEEFAGEAAADETAFGEEPPFIAESSGETEL